MIQNAESSADDYFQKGNTFYATGKHENAIICYKKAIDIDPHYFKAHYNLGAILQNTGSLAAALECYTNVLNIKPDAVDAYYNIGISLRNMRFAAYKPELAAIILKLLEQNSYIRPSEIAHSIVSLLKKDPLIEKYLLQHKAIKSEKDFQNIIMDLANSPLLMRLMNLCPIPDLDIEFLLTSLRSHATLYISSIKYTRKMSEFLSALSSQCFINEYIYETTAIEIEAISNIEQEVKEKLSEDIQPSPVNILILASYKSLDKYSWSNLLKTTAELAIVFKRQINEVEEETKISVSIPTLEKITDPVSSNVQAQYQANPYPRWISLRLERAPQLISNIINKARLKLYDERIVKFDSPEILIAGCGTGQQSIETASRFKDSSILAVDLSLSSLAYAKRKTEELGIDNIEYVQADILDLHKLDRQFDIIESCGVLHHMRDPIAGWKILAECLKNGGLMKIALYSGLARRDITKVREGIKQSGLDSTDLSMKTLRNTVVSSNDELHNYIIQFNDFYSMSELRDLLFHTQEHHFTINQIQGDLEQLRLKFCGFESDRAVQEFSLRNIKPNALYDLEIWDRFEHENQNTFSNMYQFWCQKID